MPIQVYMQKSANTISRGISLAMSCFLNSKQILITEPRFEKSSNSLWLVFSQEEQLLSCDF